MELTILDEARHPSVKELLITTSHGSQFQVAEGRDGTLVISAGMALITEPYSFGVVVLRQVEGRWNGAKEAEGG